MLFYYTAIPLTIDRLTVDKFNHSQNWLVLHPSTLLSLGTVNIAGPTYSLTLF